MSQPAANGQRPPPSPGSLLEAQQRIAATRADLGQTVEALSARLDVKARAHARLAQWQLQAGELWRTRPEVVVAGGAAAAGLAAWLVAAKVRS